MSTDLKNDLKAKRKYENIAFVSSTQLLTIIFNCDKDNGYKNNLKYFIIKKHSVTAFILKFTLITLFTFVYPYSRAILSMVIVVSNEFSIFPKNTKQYHKSHIQQLLCKNHQ